MRNFYTLEVWQRSHALVLTLFTVTDVGERPRPPGLVSQLRRAAITIPTNLAKGCGHDSRREFARYLAIAAASAVELEYLLLLARDLGVLSELHYGPLAAEAIAVRRMCQALRHHVLREERMA